MTVEKLCGKCPLKGSDEPECEMCMGFLPEGAVQDKNELANPFDRIDFEVIGATREEMSTLKQKFRDIVDMARDNGRLPTEPMMLRIFMVRVLQKLLSDHYNGF